MHATYAEDRGASPAGGWFRASFPPAPAAAPDAPPPVAAHGRGGYGEQGGPNLKCIATVLAIHAVVLVGLVKADVIPLRQKAPPPLVIDLVAEPPAPPPPPAAPEPEVRQVVPVRPVVVAPPPLVVTPGPPPPVAVVAEAPPPQAVVVAPVARAAVASAPVSVDLSASLIYIKAPRVPAEARRKREGGTVTLWVVVGTDGTVARISVSQSSGSAALDEAALDAVRKWRWRPTLQGGEAVMVSGRIPITFNVTG